MQVVMVCPLRIRLELSHASHHMHHHHTISTAFRVDASHIKLVNQDGTSNSVLYITIDIIILNLYGTS